MTTSAADDAARALIRTAIDRTIVVEAAAGTGKTTELVSRIVRVLAEGRAEVDRIAAVTFTEKAAGELKLRLRQRLEQEGVEAGAEPSAVARLTEAVRRLEEAHISTIHGLCADLLRERPVEARIDPLFRVLSEGQARALFDEAFGAWFQSTLESPPEGVRRSLRRPGRAPRPGEADDDGPIDRLRRAGIELAEWRSYRGAWTREPFDRRAAIGVVLARLGELAGVSAGASYAGDNLSVDTEPVRRLYREIAGADPGAATEATLDGIEAQLVELRKNREFKRARKGSGPTYAKGVPRAQVLQARDALVLALDDFQVRADADLAARLHEELQGCLAAYAAAKEREGALDYQDLLLRARDLVRDDAVVRRHFQRRFTHLFVDEFQDTDPVQAELLLLLASGDPDVTRWEDVTPAPGKLFIVGDPKQSIYRFRGADVDVYRRVRDQLVRAGGTVVELRRSFRSVPAIRRLVNTAFAPLMDGDIEARQAQWVPLEGSRPDDPARPAVVVLPVPEPYGPRGVSAREIERSLPDAVGAYVQWLLRESGWRVTERRDPDRRVALEPRHVCILFRRFVSYGEDATRPYVDALEARGIRHLLVGGKAFHDREEIETVRAALMAIEWPDDQLSVFAALRGALFAVGDEELLEFHRIAGRFHPFRIPSDLPAALDPIRQALEVLRMLHVRRNARPVAETVAELLEHTRAHVGFVLRPAGEQALANVLHVGELARQYERDGGMSFRGFVERLREAAAGGQAAEAPILEEGSDGVRLMTVHKAKGLEFPVVILADITARLTPTEASRHVDGDRCAIRIGGWSPRDLNDHRALELSRETAEGRRVAYVAATRARDLLVVPAVGDEAYDEGWIAPLNAAVYPDEGVRRAAEPGPGCPPFKSRDSVLSRPGGDPASRLTVCPGRHRHGSGDDAYETVWWSPEPERLELGVQAPFGLRRDDLIVKDVEPAVLQHYLAQHASWRRRRDAAVAAGRLASLEVVTATEHAAAMVVSGEAPPRASVRVETLDGAGARPAGPRFGALVHALLSDAPLDGAAAAVLPGLASGHGRLLGADRTEVAAAVELVTRVLQHDLLRAAARAAEGGRCYRETPVTLRVGERLVEGVVDLAFDTGEAIVVVDFKTDRAEGDALDRYLHQVGLYAEAIAAAMGRPARAVLLQV